MRKDRPCKDDSEPAPDPEQPRDERDATGDALARELVADDPEREREDRAADALDDAGADQHGERRGEGCQQRSCGEAREHDDERALLPEHVPESSCDRRCDRRRQEVGREDPGHACRCGVEILLEGGQCRHDERLQHCVRAARQGEDGKDAAGTSAAARGASCAVTRANLS